MVILLYHSRMLSDQQIRRIPRTTRNDWNRFTHSDYFGYDMAKDYIADFDYIKEVLTNKHLKQGMKILCSLSLGYRTVIRHIENNKKLLKSHSQNISSAIEHFAHTSRLSLSDAAVFFGVNRHWFYRHRKKSPCQKSVLNRCFRQHPNQLTMDEVSCIQSVVVDPKNFGKTKTSLYFQSIRAQLFACSLSTFFKYADLLGYRKPPKPIVPLKTGFRATRPFEWLHVDVTHVPTLHHGMQYVAFVKDNFSKAILAYKSIPTHPDSSFTRDLFIETFNTYNLLENSYNINILSDGGSENKGALLEWVNQINTPPLVKKLTAKTDLFPFSNSMSESTHAIFKTEFLQRKISPNRKQHLKDLNQFVYLYNHQRFPFELYGLTPMEVLNGEIPSRHRFAEQTAQARILRLEKNKNFNQCPLICRP